MKRILITSLLVATGLGLFAQASNKAKDLLKSKKVEEAKAEIDKVLANEKNAKDAEAWYVKAKIYSQLAEDSMLRAKVPEARTESFEAIKKYSALDDKKMISLTLDNYKPIMDIYQGYFKTGAAYYNNNNFFLRHYTLTSTNLQNINSVCFQWNELAEAIDIDLAEILYFKKYLFFVVASVINMIKTALVHFQFL